MHCTAIAFAISFRKIRCISMAFASLLAKFVAQTSNLQACSQNTVHVRRICKFRPKIRCTDIAFASVFAKFAAQALRLQVVSHNRKKYAKSAVLNLESTLANIRTGSLRSTAVAPQNTYQ